VSKGVQINIYKLFLCACIIAGITACFVKPIPTDGLPCGKQGECSTGFRCYVVPGKEQPRCLSNGNGFDLFVLDASTDIPDQHHVEDDISDITADLDIAESQDIQDEPTKTEPQDTESTDEITPDR
jgi:hypothetical protein